MQIYELEKYLASIIRDGNYTLPRDAYLSLQNMMASCRSLLGLENIVNSELINDEYKFVMLNNLKAFFNAFEDAVMRRLTQFGINNSKYTSIYPQAPTFNTYPQMPQSQFNPQAQMYGQPIYAQPQYAQPTMMQQMAAANVQPSNFMRNQPIPPVQQAQPIQSNSPSQAVNPQPQTIATQQPNPTQPGQHTSSVNATMNKQVDNSTSHLDEQYVQAEDANTNSNTSDFDFNLPLDGGKSGPAKGRDFLLNLLSKNGNE